MSNPRAEIIFVDVDETLVRLSGMKRTPMAPVVERVRDLKLSGATLYCWSKSGAEYARVTAIELGLEDCFVAFLPKPTIMLDDQAPGEWRHCRHVHPFNVSSIETDRGELAR
jgi:predicted HAD superfamily phosphohydrolase YqeG